VGLDNLPATLPCRLAGSPVKDADGTIDCDHTIAAGGCPWDRDKPTDGEPVYGIMGTYCWYRGKRATAMLAVLVQAGHRLPDDLADGFYGHDDKLSPDYCRRLRAWMAERGEAYLALVPAEQRPAEAAFYRYAVWWLGWIAEAGEGAVAWW